MRSSAVAHAHELHGEPGAAADVYGRDRDAAARALERPEQLHRPPDRPDEALQLAAGDVVRALEGLGAGPLGVTAADPGQVVDGRLDDDLPLLEPDRPLGPQPAGVFVHPERPAQPGLVRRVDLQRLADELRAQEHHLRPVVVELDQGPVLVEDDEIDIGDRLGVYKQGGHGW